MTSALEFEQMSLDQRDAYFADGARTYRQKKASDQTQQGSKYIPAYRKGLVTLSGEELLKREFPAREMLLAPLLPSKGLAMLFAERGIGKTWIGLNIAHAVAGGGAFLRWSAPLPRRVCYIDGEMPAITLKERFAAIVAGSDFDAPEASFKLIAADLQADGLPDLADVSAQSYYDSAIQGADLIIVDNLSTVCPSLRENEADSWGPMQAWCLRQRAAGKSVLLIHHAGKGGEQRGTSRKEDILDSVIRLKRPPIDHNGRDGARFEVHYTKTRGFWGDDAAPFEARLTDGKWTVGEIVSADGDDAIHALRNEGMSIRDIAERLGLSKSAVDRKLNGGGK